MAALFCKMWLLLWQTVILNVQVLLFCWQTPSSEWPPMINRNKHAFCGCKSGVTSCPQVPPSCLWTHQAGTAVSALSCCCRRSKRTTRTASASCSTGGGPRPPRSMSTSKVQIPQRSTLKYSKVLWSTDALWCVLILCLQRTTGLWEFPCSTPQAPPTTPGRGWS